MIDNVNTYFLKDINYAYNKSLKASLKKSMSNQVITKEDMGSYYDMARTVVSECEAMKISLRKVEREFYRNIIISWISILFNSLCLFFIPVYITVSYLIQLPTIETVSFMVCGYIWLYIGMVALNKILFKIIENQLKNEKNIYYLKITEKFIFSYGYTAMEGFFLKKDLFCNFFEENEHVKPIYINRILFLSGINLSIFGEIISKFARYDTKCEYLLKSRDMRVEKMKNCEKFVLTYLSNKKL